MNNNQNIQPDVQDVVRTLSERIGALTLDVAMLQSQLKQALAKIEELEQKPQE